MGQEYGAPPQPKRGLPVWAWFIIVPCGCLVIVVPVIAILAAILFPVFSQAREKARAVSCMSNLKQQGLGVLMYTQDYDNNFPPARTWVDATNPYVKNDSVRRCPSISTNAPDSYGYAYNSRLSRIGLVKVPAPQQTPMLYDSTNLSKNATDAVASLPNPPRHGRGNNIGYADGHANTTGTFGGAR